MQEERVGGARWIIRRASIEEILELRYRVLIVGTARASADFEGDRAPETWHFGLFDGAAAVGCASLMESQLNGVPAWQLRGMAIAEGLRGQGLGAALLRHMEARVADESPIRLLWCNARVGAAGFYERHGWRRVSGEFGIEGVGPHCRMRKELAGGVRLREGEPPR